MSSVDTKLGTTGHAGQRFWEALAEPERSELRTAGSLRSFPAGAILFHEGDQSHAVLIVLHGLVKVIMNSAGGHKRLLAVRGYGEVIGEVSAVWQIPRSATVQAIGGVEILLIPRVAFVRTLHRFPSAAMELIRILGERRRYADHERAEFGGSTVTQRVAAVLVDVATQYPRTVGGAVVVPFTQEELASLAATSPSGVARALSALRGRNAVVTAPGQTTVLNIEVLRTVAAKERVSSDTALAPDLG